MSKEKWDITDATFLPIAGGEENNAADSAAHSSKTQKTSGSNVVQFGEHGVEISFLEAKGFKKGCKVKLSKRTRKTNST